MKKIQMFQADDGTLHKTEVEAQCRDTVYGTVGALNKLLSGDVAVSSLDFTNGCGFYLLSADKVRQFDNMFVATVKLFHPEIYEALGGNIKTSGIVGRYLCDSDSPLYSSYILRQCVDSQCRRWGQAYFAANPSEGENVKLGDI